MIATSINQSKKLIELGLDAATSDMQYFPLENNKYDLVTYQSCTRGVIPAWSLSALMRLMPYPSLHNFFNDKWRCDLHYEDGDVRKFGEDTDSPLDAAFEMVCYLLKTKNL